MSALEPLCNYCAKIELDHKRLSKLKSSDHGGWLIGQRSRIKNSRCPICRLVEHVLYEMQWIASEDVQTAFSSERMANSIWGVTLVWDSSLGPGNRGAFHVTAVSGPCICFSGKADYNGLVAGPDYMLSKLPSELGVGRVSRWLRMCTSTHSTYCNFETPGTFENAFPGLRVLRFIDVERKCLVETQSICQYIALSYVWGNVSTFRLTKANIRELLISGSIETIWTKLPRTIRAAVELTRALGLRYLWVDALCLLQNDQEDLLLGVAVMDCVYELSWLTIIAACGHNANAGLPGVLEGSRKTSPLALKVKKGISLGVYSGLNQLLKRSVYSSRAWTFQEQFLARRAVYFVDNQVFFRCREAEYTESCFDHPTSNKPVRPPVTYRTPNPKSNDSILSSVMHMSSPIQNFATILHQYTQRALTNQNDVLNAVAGIMRRLSERLKYPFFQGLPTGVFDAFILFRAENDLHRRHGFPSYSWIGWKGEIKFEDPGPVMFRNMNDWLSMKTWIIWYKRSPSGITNLVWDPSAYDSFPSHDLEWLGYRKRRAFRSPPTLKMITSRTSPTEVLVFNIPPLTYPLLQFWTLAVFYRIDINVFTAEGNVLDESGTICGKILLDCVEEMIFFGSGQLFEFILLSENRLDKYNAMLLEWDGGVAERRGMGILEQWAIHKSFPPGPIWKEILLA